MRANDTLGVTAPTMVLELEIGPVPTLTRHGPANSPSAAPQALVLVRLHSHPLGTLIVDTGGRSPDPHRLALMAEQAFAEPIADHLESDGLPASGSRVDGRPRCLERRTSLPTPPITVVVATRERPEKLAACLDALQEVDYQDYEVVVVDNDPVTDATAALVRDRGDRRVRYVREDRRGLAAAHNCGLRVSEGTIVAFTDDDVEVDRHWLTEVAAGFSMSTDVACVTGLILPAELETEAQVLLEAHGRFGKGFRPRIFDSLTNRPDDPLFPFTAGQLGSGANMSFDRVILRRIGGFDGAIGAGTPARGGDDLAAFFSVIASGHQLAYQPGALVWHHHRRDTASLTRQAFGYGVGLGAYLASSLVHHPSMIPAALRRAPSGLAYAIHPRSARNAHRPAAWAGHLARLERHGLAVGGLAYGASLWSGRKHSKLTARQGSDRARDALVPQVRSMEEAGLPDLAATRVGQAELSP